MIYKEETVAKPSRYSELSAVAIGGIARRTAFMVSALFLLASTSVVLAQNSHGVETFVTVDGPSAADSQRRAQEPAGAAAPAYVRVYWASPELAAIGPVFDIDHPVDIRVGELPIAEGLAPREITGYREVPAGLWDVLLLDRHQAKPDAGFPVRLEANRYYTVVLEGYCGDRRLFAFDDVVDDFGPPQLRVVRIVPFRSALEVEIMATERAEQQRQHRDVLTDQGDSTSYLPVAVEVDLEVMDALSDAAVAAAEVSGLEPGTSATVWLIESGARKDSESGTLTLGDGRFVLSVAWSSGDESGLGQGVPLTSDTAAFWFFNDRNYELMVKVLDGRDINGKFWVFYGSLTDVAFRLQVQDRTTGETVTYLNNEGGFKSRGDIDALDP